MKVPSIQGTTRLTGATGNNATHATIAQPPDFTPQEGFTGQSLAMSAPEAKTSSPQIPGTQAVTPQPKAAPIGSKTLIDSIDSIPAEAPRVLDPNSPAANLPADSQTQPTPEMQAQKPAPVTAASSAHRLPKRADTHAIAAPLDDAAVAIAIPAFDNEIVPGPAPQPAANFHGNGGTSVNAPQNPLPSPPPQMQPTSAAISLPEIAFQVIVTPITENDSAPAKTDAQQKPTQTEAGPLVTEKREVPEKVVAAAATASTMNDLGRNFQAPVAQERTVAADQSVKTEAPFRMVADTLRTTEPAAPPITPRSNPVETIALRIVQPDAPSVDLHVTERAGEIHVAVRTPDVGLQTSLRQDLGTLSNSLERAGYHTETFVPHEAKVEPAGIQTARADLRGNHRESESGSHGRGTSGDAQQNRDQRRQHPSKSWFQELENLQ
jgi:hypothetical protein